jgi:threonine synthase
MNYISTRGSITEATSAEAIRMGIAPDGGLFTPETIPTITPKKLEIMVDYNYQELATYILFSYLTDYKAGRLLQMVEAAYSYPAKFAHPKVTPVVKLRDGQYILELWHGPTCAFKDVALQLLPYLMTEASQLANDSTELVILVATSGDTGKAALEGFRDVPGTRIIVFFPDQGVSEIQRLQMVTQEGKNTHVVSVQGNFDDAQNGVKQIFGDPAVADKLKANRMAFTSANSINWGRLAPQIVYYFFGYCELCRQGSIKLGEEINITVPTGNFGNILAAYFAKRMGLPVKKLICASNSNDVLTDFIKTGIYDRNRQFHTTISPSMDILISSNLERLLFYLADSNPALVSDWMSQLKTTGRYQVGETIRAKVNDEFYGGFATEPETMNLIKQVFEETGMVLDTHTAVGVVVYERYLRESGDGTPNLTASTASPFKFNSSVLKAISGEKSIAGCGEFALLEQLNQLSGLQIPESLKALDRKPVLHKKVCRKDEMGRIVEGILGV